MLLLYLSIERLYSIKNQRKRFMLRNMKYQLIYFLVVISFNLLLYIPIPVFNEIYFKNSTQEWTCDFIEREIEQILLTIDLLNLIVIPDILMIVCSVLLIRSIFSLRNKIRATFLSKENKSFRKDIKLSITSLSLNIIYVALNLPFSILNFTSNLDRFLDIFLMYLFYSSYAISFYVVLITNSLFYKEVFKVFGNRNEIPGIISDVLKI